MTLIVVMSVMNGFQMTFIDSILEISSYHLRASNIEENYFEFEDFCADNKYVTFATPFYEAQTLMAGNNGREQPALIRAIDPSSFLFDEGFAKEIEMRSGVFSLEEKNSIVLGSTLARKIGVKPGDLVNLFVFE